ncbi:hypothetical protein AB0M45_15535 [Nocardia sp. NPDC051787]|uniref:hypothetical protein n=1 Tax=Nocardia sp. NPDC051787 TaxID=3155415 RepID=UPI00342E9FCE
MPVRDLTCSAHLFALFGDLSDKIMGKPPVPVVLVLCCSFVFLVAAFRRIALPERAVVMSPPCTKATLGSAEPFRLVRPMDAPRLSVSSGAFVRFAKYWAARPRVERLSGLRTR